MTLTIGKELTELHEEFTTMLRKKKQMFISSQEKIKHQFEIATTLSEVFNVRTSAFIDIFMEVETSLTVKETEKTVPEILAALEELFPGFEIPDDIYSRNDGFIICIEEIPVLFILTDNPHCQIVKTSEEKFRKYTEDSFKVVCQ